MRYALLLDSGALIQLGSKIRTHADARIALKSWKQSRRQMIQRGDIITPRVPLGLVTFKRKHENQRRLAPIDPKR